VGVSAILERVARPSLRDAGAGEALRIAVAICARDDSSPRIRHHFLSYVTPCCAIRAAAFAMTHAVEKRLCLAPDCAIGS